MTDTLNLPSTSDGSLGPDVILRRTHDAPRFDPWLLVTFTGMIIVFLLLLYRSMGLLPIVMADEWEYSLHSRLLPLAVTARPFYLYLWLFRHTNYCGCAYLQCARVFNCVLFVGAAPFIYKTARQVTTSRVATLVALLSIAAPVNTYTAYYMPEAMYFAGFWVLSWFLFAFRRMPPYSYGFWAGIILAGMSMIKVHGIFLFPAVALLVIALALRSHASNHWRDLVVSLGCLILGFAVVRFSLGFVFAGLGDAWWSTSALGPH